MFFFKYKEGKALDKLISAQKIDAMESFLPWSEGDRSSLSDIGDFVGEEVNPRATFYTKL